MAARPPTPFRRPPGASIVEFAVIAPLLFALLLGIVKYGRLFMAAQGP